MVKPITVPSPPCASLAAELDRLYPRTPWRVPPQYWPAPAVLNPKQ
jgi:hypothetical protein